MVSVHLPCCPTSPAHSPMAALKLGGKATNSNSLHMVHTYTRTRNTTQSNAAEKHDHKRAGKNERGVCGKITHSSSAFSDQAKQDKQQKIKQNESVSKSNGVKKGNKTSEGARYPPRALVCFVASAVDGGIVTASAMGEVGVGVLNGSHPNAPMTITKAARQQHRN